jgi:orotidine-5'-phosphate decarboxylase
MAHFADRLTAAVQARATPLCVGLDPRWDSLPLALRQRFDASPAGRASAYEAFCLRVLDIVAPHAGVIKPQSAFFEACGPDGLKALLAVMRRARQLGLVTILDAKRGDIASTAEAYAEMAFDVYDADAITLNPYLGKDAIEPFLKRARQNERGLFVLVRTSNPGGGQFQNLAAAGKPLYVHVADAVESWSNESRGGCGLGDVGAVVGATHPTELRELRKIMPSAIFLVPGYGAQGASAADTAGAFLPGGRGAVVNSARGITFPFKPDDANWEAAIDAATQQAAHELGQAANPHP